MDGYSYVPYFFLCIHFKYYFYVFLCSFLCILFKYFFMYFLCILYMYYTFLLHNSAEVLFYLDELFDYKNTHMQVCYELFFCVRKSKSDYYTSEKIQIKKASAPNTRDKSLNFCDTTQIDVKYTHSDCILTYAPR